jgi:hypothetical protein
VVDLRFLRQLSRPNALRPEAKSGKEAGSGISDSPEIPVKLIPVTVTGPPKLWPGVVAIETDVKSGVPVNVKTWETVSGAIVLPALVTGKILGPADAPSLPVPVTATCPKVMTPGAEALTEKVTSVNLSNPGTLTVLPMTVALVVPIGTAVGSVVCVSVAA